MKVGGRTPQGWAGDSAAIMTDATQRWERKISVPPCQPMAGPTCHTHECNQPSIVSSLCLLPIYLRTVTSFGNLATPHTRHCACLCSIQNRFWQLHHCCCCSELVRCPLSGLPGCLQVVVLLYPVQVAHGGGSSHIVHLRPMSHQHIPVTPVYEKRCMGDRGQGTWVPAISPPSHAADRSNHPTSEHQGTVDEPSEWPKTDRNRQEARQLDACMPKPRAPCPAGGWGRARWLRPGPSPAAPSAPGCPSWTHAPGSTTGSTICSMVAVQ